MASRFRRMSSLSSATRPLSTVSSIIASLSRSKIEAEKLDRIVADQPAARLIRKPLEVMLDDLPRIGKGHVEVRIVVRPHTVLFAPPGESAGPDIILEEGAEHMFREQLAWHARDCKPVLAVALEVIIPLLQQEG